MNDKEEFSEDWYAANVYFRNIYIYKVWKIIWFLLCLRLCQSFIKNYGYILYCRLGIKISVLVFYDRTFGTKWEGPYNNCIRVTHFYSDTPSGLRTWINKDSCPLSIFVLFLHHYQWMRQSDTITSIWMLLMKDFIHYLIWQYLIVLVFSLNCREGTWFTRICEIVMLD
jgi:hypothetical protein